MQLVRRKLGTTARLARHGGWTHTAGVPKMLSVYVLRRWRLNDRGATRPNQRLHENAPQCHHRALR